MSHRQDEKQARREQRMERERAAAEAARRKRLVGYGVAGVLALAAMAALVVVVLGVGGDDGGGGGGEGLPEPNLPAAKITDLARAVEAAGCEDRQFKSEGAGHVEEDVTYKSNPPHSGPHYQIPAEDGQYDDPPRKEALVHALEHGRIIVQYKPDVAPIVKSNLTKLFDENAYHVILTPNGTGMRPPIAVTAWTRVLTCPRVTPQVYDAIRTFRDQYVDQGPEKVP